MGTGGWRDYLAFRVGRLDCAVDAARIRAILPGPELLPWDCLVPGLIGIADYQHHPLAVLDPQHRFALTRPNPQQISSKSKLIVADVFRADAHSLFGFLVDHISGVLSYHPRDLRDGLLLGQGRRRRLIDLEALVTPDIFAFLAQLVN